MEFEKSQIDINCPECDFINSVTLADVINGSSIICVGCLKTIQLIDDSGQTKRTTDELNQALNDIGKAFK